MKAIFSPAMFLMDRLKYPVKFTLIFVIVLVPLVVLSVNFISAINKDIAFLENERTGLRYIKIVRQPIQYMQQHRGMTAAYLNGASQFKSRILDKRKQVDAKLAELVAIDKELGDAMNTQGLVSKVQQQWNAIKANSMNMKTGAAIKVHSDMIADLLALMTSVADSSEITLDPQLDSYYMGAALVSGLPKMLENMGQARAVGSGVAAKGSFTPKSFTRLSVLDSNISNFFTDLRAGMNAAFEMNPAVAKKLKAGVDSNNKAVENM